ncbi:Non-specific serine/threonine protein kinase [Bertholletia excelsa]
MMVSAITFLVIFTCLSLFTIIYITAASDTISTDQTLIDGGATLVSAGQTFKLGFFSPPNSTNRYIGIWFNNVPLLTPIWVANKNSPLTGPSGVLSVNATGTVVISDDRFNIIWSSNSSSASASNPVLQLLDTGNLVVKNGGAGDISANYLWQSFDHPCDTLLAGMKLGWDLRTGQEWYLTSWKSLQDPSSGEYTYRLDPRGLPQMVLRQGQHIKYRSGPWDGVRFGGAAPLQENAVFNPLFVFNSTFVYYYFLNTDRTTITRFVVNQTGLIQQLTWNQRQDEWIVLATLQGDTCDSYDQCGPYGICDINSPSVICNCPHGFVPRLSKDWNQLDWSGGCVLRTPLNCSNSEPQGFRKFSGVKLPDTSSFLVNRSEMSQADCESACLSNCSCVAYAKTEVNGCVAWFDDLRDIREFTEGGQDLYVRMAISELGSIPKKKHTKEIVIESITVTSGILVLGFVSWYVIKKRAEQRRGLTGALRQNYSMREVQDESQQIQKEDLELPLFDFTTISAATDSFSFTNKIGEGGFGQVYRGQLPPGKEIAVKRLSKTSGQGLKEFKNEVILISKLQHRNLVGLLGCCIHGEERMLIYEYLSNKSLDLFIFNQTKGTSLAWQKRFDIIVGIARGLLYLHRDSRLRIIHRDLKASNILLDSKMNPKISDFGLARTFNADQSVENTSRIMGTYGYMSPEYAIDGLFR